MIVFDTSALIGAAIQRSTPSLAFFHAVRFDLVAISHTQMTELRQTMKRPRLARFINPLLRDELLTVLDASGIHFDPTEQVRECRDPKDDIYLELAIASRADSIVTSDNDLLVMHPWRGIRILRPAEYLAPAGQA